MNMKPKQQSAITHFHCCFIFVPPVPLDTCALRSSTVLADLRWEEGAGVWGAITSARLSRNGAPSRRQMESRLPKRSADETHGLRIQFRGLEGSPKSRCGGLAAVKWNVWSLSSCNRVSWAHGPWQLYANECWVHVARAVGRWRRAGTGPAFRHCVSWTVVGCACCPGSSVGQARRRALKHSWNLCSFSSLCWYHFNLVIAEFERLLDASAVKMKIFCRLNLTLVRNLFLWFCLGTYNYNVWLSVSKT